jgi:hypothetical protein
MDDIKSASNEKKIEFLLVVLEAEEKRRQAIESKSTILTTSNAILLSAIIWLGLPLTTNVGPIQWLQFALIVIALGAVILSVILTVQAITRITQKQRSRIMDLGPDFESEHNLFFFGGIANFEKEDYRCEIDALTEQEILRQLTSQVHNLSRLLWHRYRIMDFATVAFIVGMVTFALLALTKLLVR